MTLWYRRLRKLEGHHFGVLCCALVAAVTFAVNLIFMIWAISGFEVHNGLGTLYDGNCKRTASLTFWIHLAINILSTLLLGASNYSMQCLSSPTRSEIDKAHSQGVWLDVGVPSVRNLRKLSGTRITLWWFLAVSSIPLHLLYNSAVFSSLCTRKFDIFLVSNEFLNGAPFGVDAGDVFFGEWYDEAETPKPLKNRLQEYQKNQGSLLRLENEKCQEVYTAQIIATNSDLLLISAYSNFTDSLLGWDAGVTSRILGNDGLCNTMLCSGIPNCVPSGIIANPQDWSISLGLGALDGPMSHDVTCMMSLDFAHEARIRYCLSVPVDEHCKLQFSLAIMIAVIICNLIKAVCMSVIVWKQDPEPLVTLGDAISSFLDRPDLTTAGNCLVGKTRFEDSRSWDLLPSAWNPKILCWFQAASSRRWLVCNIL